MKFTWLESLIQDLRYGARGFARNPIFTLTAVFAAALGIGASTAVFSVVDRILFRSLPYPDEDRLVSVGMMTPLDTNEVLFAGSYLDWRKNQTPFESIISRRHRRHGGLALRDTGLFQHARCTNRARPWI